MGMGSSGDVSGGIGEGAWSRKDACRIEGRNWVFGEWEI